MYCSVDTCAESFNCPYHPLGILEFTSEFFEHSQQAWRKNKTKIIHKRKWGGSFRYGCEHKNAKGFCNRKIANGDELLCNYHARQRRFLF